MDRSFRRLRYRLNGEEIYLSSNPGSGRSVLVVNSSTLAQTASVNVGGYYSQNLIISPSGQYLYVITYRHIQEIETPTLKVVRSELSSYLHITDNMAVSPNGKTLYLYSAPYGGGSGYNGGQLSILNADTLQVMANRRTGSKLDNPCGFAANPNGSSVYARHSAPEVELRFHHRNWASRCSTPQAGPSRSRLFFRRGQGVLSSARMESGLMLAMTHSTAWTSSAQEPIGSLGGSPFQGRPNERSSETNPYLSTS